MFSLSTHEHTHTHTHVRPPAAEAFPHGPSDPIKILIVKVYGCLKGTRASMFILRESSAIDPRRRPASNYLERERVLLEEVDALLSGLLKNG